MRHRNQQPLIGDILIHNLKVDPIGNVWLIDRDRSLHLRITEIENGSVRPRKGVRMHPGRISLWHANVIFRNLQDPWDTHYFFASKCAIACGTITDDPSSLRVYDFHTSTLTILLLELQQLGRQAIGRANHLRWSVVPGLRRLMRSTLLRRPSAQDIADRVEDNRIHRPHATT